MNARRSFVAPLVALAALTLEMREARAYHTKEQRITDGTAETMRAHDLRLGLWKAEYAPWGPLMVGTYIWPWFFKVSNLELKWRFYHDDSVSLAVRTGFFHFDTKNLNRVDDETGDARIDSVPFELAGTYRFSDRYSLTLATIFTRVRVDGALAGTDLRGSAEGAFDNFQAVANFEWRLGEVTAFLFEARRLVFQRVTATGDAVLHPDDFTTVELHLGGQSTAVDFRNAWSLAASAVFSWNVWNLRLGLGYGNYNVPGVNFVTGQRVLFPDLDVYWIF